MIVSQEISRLGISVVVPVYNSEQSLVGVVERIERVLDQTGSEYEVVLVNDGSRDGSWRKIQELASQNPAVRGVQLMRNYGQHNALLCGIRSAVYRTVVTLDDDGQNPPEEIPKRLARLDEGYDLVYGVPEHAQHSFWRNATSRLTKLAMQSVLGAESACQISAFKA